MHCQNDIKFCVFKSCCDYSMHIRQESELEAVNNFGKARVCLNVCAFVTLHTADGIVIPLSVNMDICFF